jgi:hypothetical protein
MRSSDFSHRTDSRLHDFFIIPSLKTGACATGESHVMPQPKGGRYKGHFGWMRLLLQGLTFIGDYFPSEKEAPMPRYPDKTVEGLYWQGQAVPVLPSHD